MVKWFGMIKEKAIEIKISAEENTEE
jgi:hypothetical protein